MNSSHGFHAIKVPVFLALLAVFVFTLFPQSVWARRRAVALPQGEEAVAAYLVKETGHSDFLKAKEIDKQLSPASLTKIMTCMLAIESGRMDDVVSIPLEATQVEPTRAGFEPGERIRLRDLVKAAMVNSSNDAAFAIAIHLGGSVDAFVATMNARARALGMTHTQFTNPAGFDRSIYAGNHTTARDLMILTERAIRYSEFNTIAKLESAVFSELSTGKSYSLRTHNKLMDRYPYTVGIKTGYTAIAGPCLVARALKDGKDMLIIMLGARTDRWSLASNMFDQGFGGGAGTVQVATAAPESPRKDSVAAPVAPASKVLAARSRALEALKHKVQTQSVSRSEVGVQQAGKSDRSVAKSSLKANRLERSRARLALKSHSKSSNAEKLSLRDGTKKGKAQKKLLAKARQRHLKEQMALRSEKKAGARIALKSDKKERHAIAVTRTRAGKHPGVQARNDKRKSSRKGELSLSKKRSSNG